MTVTPERLAFLINLRNDAGLSQKEVAALFGLQPKHGYKEVGKWERGENSPPRKHRTKFIGYLWERLGLRRQPQQFHTYWATLVEEWAWLPITAADGESFPAVVASLPTTEHPAPVAPNLEPLQRQPSLLLLYQSPPEITQVVKRKERLEYYAAEARRDGVVVITGMAGIGKTTLAATLAHQIAAQPNKIFWYAFHVSEREDGVLTLLTHLANFLAHHGNPNLWQKLQTIEQTGSKLPPFRTLLDEVLLLCQGQHYILCLDDFHHVTADPRADLLLQQLQQRAATHDLTLIITARQLPSAMQSLPLQPLGGLTLVETKELWLQARAPYIAAAQLETLWHQTKGHAKTLVLTVAWLHGQREPAAWLDRLMQVDSIEFYLLTEIDAHFTETERQLMNALTVLSSDTATRPVLEALVQADLYRPLLELTRRHLVTAINNGTVREYQQHAIIQAFYDQALDRPTRLLYHRRAGDYFSQNGADRIAAIEHYLQAEELFASAQLLGQDARELINRGYADRLRKVIRQLDPTPLPATLQAAVYITQSAVELALDNLILAESLALMAQPLLPASPTADHIRVLTNLSTINYHLGEIDQAIAYAQQGQQISEQLQDHSGALTLLNNLAVCTELKGDWGQAAQLYQQAIKEAEQLDNIANQILTRNNLGILYTNRGDYPAAQQELERALALADEWLYKDNLLSILASLANLAIRRADVAAANTYLNEARHLIDETGAQSQSAEIYTYRAQVMQLQGDLVAAHDAAQQAVERAHRLQMEIEEGKARRVLGEILLAQGEVNAAKAELDASSRLVKGELYEVARTQIDLGLCLQKMTVAGAQAQGRSLLAQAQTTFAQLGAHQDMRVVTEYLRRFNDGSDHGRPTANDG